MMKKAVMPGLACAAAIALAPSSSGGAERDDLKREFQKVVHPFVETYCTGCHGGEKPKAKFDLSPYDSLESVAVDFGHWDIVLERLHAEEMPPEEADKFPDTALREQVIGWIERLRRHEAERNAGDPGPVLARRLSNAEYDYSIHDLTGVEIRPTREFPIDPANEAGFDNSGESLRMSPALLNKYLAAARQVADHLLFLPDGLDFAPHPAVIYSDRDKYCVHRIVDFYKEQPTDYAAYFYAAWQYRHRAKLGLPEAVLEDIARADGISAKYLETTWVILNDSKNNAGPIAEMRKHWNLIPEPENVDAGNHGKASEACRQLGERVTAERKKLSVEIRPADFAIKGLHQSSQPLVLWMNREQAANRRLGKLPDPDGAAKTDELRAAVTRFCKVFPDAFYWSERGRMFLPPEKRNKGRLLSAGFHMMVGYFRDDAPLYDLILHKEQQEKLDAMWRELDFITRAPVRQFGDFVYLERAEKPGFLQSDEFAFARPDASATEESKMRRLAKLYLAKVRAAGIDEKVVAIIEDYFEDMSARIRRLEKETNEAQPHHLEALLELAGRAWQRTLTEADREGLDEFYRSLKEQESLSHEDAVRDTLASVLMSPRFFYRTTVPDPGPDETALSGNELASRLSYFLWSSIPDAELLKLAEAGDLQNPEVLLEQTRRMLRDPRVRRLAVEFGGNWLDFRRFESHNGVNREHFTNFTDDLRQAMFEEPIRFLTDLVQRDGSVLEFTEADHTFVNAVLAEHYGLPFSQNDPNEWVRVDDTRQFGRGGLLPMSVFLTANSPGLRTSPVKRGYWVVRRLLGERIPPPPPDVPDLPEDESKLGDLSLREVLAKHRENESCAKCHERFDSFGLVFEGYGPVGERRKLDLGGRLVDTAAVFPDGSTGEGLDGLRRHLREIRRDELVDNLCRKLLSYALGRSLLLSDDSTIEKMKSRLAATDYQFNSLVETIVTSAQFLQKRGRDHAKNGTP